jgi:excisionase family DNA binding protein
MSKDQNAKNFTAMSVVDVAELLGVTDRGVRKWIKEKGLPARADQRGFTLDWPTTLKWYVDYKIAENPGTAGTPQPKTGAEQPPENYEQALARKTRAEADLKELQLARERSQVAAISDVERVLANANKSIQTLILAIPSALAPQLIGLTDYGRIRAVLDRGVKATLGNLASIDAIRQVRPAAAEDEAE